MALKIAFITDVHYGFDTGGKLGSKAPRLMKAFAKAVNKFSPTLVIDGGDRVNASSDKQQDAHYEREYRKHYNEIAAPLEEVVGNHDVVNNGHPPSYSKDYGDYHIVFWNPNVRIYKKELKLAPEHLEWLKNDLAATDKKTIIVSHVPFDNDTDDNNSKFTDRLDARFFYYEADHIRKVLEDSGKVVMCLHGHRHTHRDRVINGILYLTQQSFTSTWKKEYRVPSHTFSFIEAEADRITIHMKGKTRRTIEHNFKPMDI